MEVETIKENGKKAIADLLNKSLQVEYSFILNYPRIIDNLVIIKIHDEQLIKDLEYVGKESVWHFGWVGQLIVQLGGESQWGIEVIDRMVDVDRMLVQQLDKEKLALLLFQQAKHLAEQNRVKVKVKDFFGRLIRMQDELPVDVVNINDVISVLDHIIIDEKKHIRLVEDSIATLNMLMNK